MPLYVLAFLSPADAGDVFLENNLEIGQVRPEDRLIAMRLRQVLKPDVAFQYVIVPSSPFPGERAETAAMRKPQSAVQVTNRCRGKSIEGIRYNSPC
jgi:hypothetical protein